MPLLEAAQRVAKEFEYSDDEVLKGAKHFIAQMRMTTHVTQSRAKL
jgi:hypothetical protein